MSISDEYQTPLDFYNILNKEFRFSLDAFTTENNPLKTKFYLSKKHNSFKNNWYNLIINSGLTNNVFCNPPYSILKQCIEKSFNESLKGLTTVNLIMVDTSGSYWHDYILPFAKQIRFINGRLSYILNGEVQKNNRHASAIIIFSNTLEYEEKFKFYSKSINNYLNPKYDSKKVKKEIESIIYR